MDNCNRQERTKKYSTEQQQTIISVFRFFEKEAQNQGPHITLVSVLLRTSSALAIGMSSVKKYLKLHRNNQLSPSLQKQNKTASKVNIIQQKTVVDVFKFFETESLKNNGRLVVEEVYERTAVALGQGYGEAFVRKYMQHHNNNQLHAVPTLRGKHCTGDQIQAIVSVWRYFQLEKRNKGPLLPVRQVKDRTAAALGCARSAVQTYVRQYRQSGHHVPYTPPWVAAAHSYRRNKGRLCDQCNLNQCSRPETGAAEHSPGSLPHLLFGL